MEGKALQKWVTDALPDAFSPEIVPETWCVCVCMCGCITGCEAWVMRHGREWCVQHG